MDFTLFWELKLSPPESPGPMLEDVSEDLTLLPISAPVPLGVEISLIWNRSVVSCSFRLKGELVSFDDSYINERL